ncbi:hypothetical protein [Mesorhizobium sp.]|uniref:hypothetical protein n=1 Tax=Mesorhizobium sp. TaxID=1871066 RepID=UPI000FE9273F|nr:hypothetical protein [Mesorhizobium sp.]RWF64122.1 MAG: hypothetical protein EOS47_16255 [Mesorhizobium sp.]TIT44718.1 MAG: hypothetical protein E5W76_01175 [Mesorhizobium sp.]
MPIKVEQRDGKTVLIHELDVADAHALGIADPAEAGIFKEKEYCVTCKGNPEVKFTVHAINSTFATIEGAPKCLTKTGDPSCSAHDGRC